MGIRVYEALARAFAAEGVTHTFTLMGDGNKAWLVSMAEQRGMQLINARHEGAALAMADGYARASGKVGVCSVTYGSGLTQLATSLMVARRHRSPIVVFCPDTGTPDKGMGGQVDIDQRAFIEASGGVFHALRSAATAAEDVRLAFHKARSMQMPVVLNAPIDIQEDDYPADWDEWPYAPEAMLADPQRPRPDPTVVARAADLLVSAKRPIIIAGRGAVQSGAREAIERLGSLTGALFATTLQAKGWLDDSTFSLGIAGGYLLEPRGHLFAEADCVIAVGASLNTYTTVGGYLFPSARVVHIDLEANPLIDLRRRAEVVIRADAREAVDEIAAALERTGHRRRGYRTPEVAAMLNPNPGLAALAAAPGTAAPGEVDPRQLFITLDRSLPPSGWFTVGVGNFTSFAVMYMTNPSGRVFDVNLDFITIGQALPTAIGAALACPGRDIVAFEGDGSFMMHVQELDTAVRHGARLLVIVLNDQALGAEYHKLLAAGMDPRQSLIPTPDLASLAEAFGARGLRVSCLEEAEAVAPAFKEARGPVVVDARIAKVAGPL